MTLESPFSKQFYLYDLWYRLKAEKDLIERKEEKEKIKVKELAQAKINQETVRRSQAQNQKIERKSR